MNKIITVFLLLITTMGYSQNRKHKITKKAENKINLSFTPQIYLNNSSVENEINKTELFSTENTFGQHFGIDYQRTTRYGLIYGGGIYYGTQSHKLKATFDDMSYYDPDPTVQASLAELPVIEFPIQGKVSFGDIKLMVGYKFNVSPKRNIFIEAKIGISSRFYRRNDNSDYKRLTIGYLKNDTFFVNTQADIFYAIGYQGSSISSTQNYNFYLGFVKGVNMRFVKDVSLGLELNHGMRSKGSGGAESRHFKSDGSLYSIDKYQSKDFAIGLRMSVGLWHR